MENEPKKGKVETTRNDRRERKAKQNKTKGKLETGLVMAQLAGQKGNRERRRRTRGRENSASSLFPLLFFIVSFHANKLFNSTVWQLKANYKAKQRK